MSRAETVNAEFVLKFARWPGVPPVVLCLVTSAWLLLIDNGAFWRTAWAARDTSSTRSAMALLALGIVLWLLFALPLRLLCWGRLAKPVLVVLLLSAALVAHFTGTWGVLIDKGMIANVLQTHWGEASELLTPRLAWDMLWRGLVPALALSALRVEPVHFVATVAGIARHALLLTGVVAVALWMFFADFAATARNHRELRHLLTPTNVVNGLWGAWKERGASPSVLETVAGDAARAPRSDSTRPKVFVLVVGETARAANFSLAGYGRPTNEALAGKRVVYLGDALACGTDTATSIPCMFSDLGAAGFSPAAAARRENVLDVMARVGVAVQWIDNNAGCKGTCARVPTLNIGSAAGCAGTACLDEALVEALKARLDRTAGDALVVLHMLGSHGPAYYLRHPTRCKHFEPTCETPELQRCDLQALRNSYDNTIAYTSEVLAQIIDALEERATQFDSTMLYVSDHGESLGERNLFLHGMPTVLAPPEQTRVPMLVWTSARSPGASTSAPPLLAATARPAALSHDHLFHTVLGAFGVRTAAYRPELDLRKLGTWPSAAR